MHGEPSKPLGILMLDSQFPRIPGDIGNPDTWPFPTHIQVVKGATPQAVVCEDAEPFVQAFIAAGQSLVTKGCGAIATTCGFLTLLRPRLCSALGVPVTTSSLEQIPLVQSTLSEKHQVGVLTISADTLRDAHFHAAGIVKKPPLIGLDNSHFADVILNNGAAFDLDRARNELCDAALKLVRQNPSVRAIVLECTNMVPHAPAITQATGLPVYSIYTYLCWLQAALTPKVFPAP